MKLITKIIIVLIPIIALICVFGFATYGNDYYFDFYYNAKNLIDKLNYNYTTSITNISKQWSYFSEYLSNFNTLTETISKLVVNDIPSFFNAFGLFFQCFGQLFVLFFMAIYYILNTILTFMTLVLKNSIDLFYCILNPLFLKK